MQMLEIFTKSKIDPKIGVKPSVYARELYTSHEERQAFLNLNNDCIKLFHNRPSNQAIERWDVKPRIILFSKWTLGEEYETFFTIRNRYRTSKLLKLSLRDSPVFELEKLVNFNRLGSMVTFGYKVRFKPKEFVDYHDTIKLEAENGNLEIYVLAISPRPMIDFPDEIDFGNVLFNFENSKQIRLENISPIVVEASLETQGIFLLDNNKILLNPNETMVLKITLNERKKKKIRDKLLVRFETGERLFINLSAKCYSGRIYFEKKQEIDMGELFVGLSSTDKITLVNDTDELLSYAWMNNRNTEIDDLESHVYGYMLGNKLQWMKRKTCGMKYFRMITDETQEKISDNFIDEELNTKLTYYFTDENFDIRPVEGQINPKSKQIFVITFKPKSVKYIKKKGYLEIEGLKERLNFKLKGTGIGPQIVLNVNTIDFDQIFICSQHTYIISAKNIGLVKGTIRYISDTKLAFGETISCSPLKLELLPSEVKVFEMSLSSTVAGSFVEDVWFIIEESQKRVRCIVKGHIINPRLILDKKIINFGQVSLGFKYTSSFIITNESPIPVEYKIEVVGNGFLPAVQINTDFENSLPSLPQEFTIDPEKNQILPSYSQTVEVSLVSNIVRDHSTVLKIYLWEVLVEECFLILKYTSVTPIITCKPSEIMLRYAFIDYDYTRQITIMNSHNLPTYYVILHQDETAMISSPGLLYTLDEYSGFLGPNSSKVIQLDIRVLSLQPASEKLQLKVFGLPNIINLCTIIVYGMGPVVNPSTFSMSWGTVPVLKNIDKSLGLINVSPITAFYKMQIEKYSFIWNISKPEGSIGPESEFEIIITARLRDSGIIEDHLIVEIIGSREITISLSAHGYGTSIVTVPNLFPVYDIGKVFRKEKHDDIIKVTNAGTRHHTIMFTTMKEIKNLTKAKADQEQGAYFKLIPYKLDLEGGETQNMHLLYESEEIEVLEDTYYCYAIIERRGKRVSLGSSTIRASFTDTELTFEPTSLHFRVDVPKWSTPVLPQYKTLTVSSQWSHTLFLLCEVKKPFAFKSTKINKAISSTDEKEILNLKLEPQESQLLEIKFDPSYITNRYSRVCYAELIVTFKDHKVKANVPLRGEVNFPNIQLSSHEIDFGCVLPNTEAVQYAVLTNNTPLAIEFEWFWAQQKLFELRPDSTRGPGVATLKAENEGELSEDSSDLSCTEEEEESSEGEEEKESLGRSEIKEKQMIKDLPQKKLTKPSIIIKQALSQSDSYTSSYSENTTTITTSISSSKDSDEDDSSKSDIVVDEKKVEKIYDFGCFDCKPVPLKHKRKSGDGYFIDRINEFGINQILRRIPSTSDKSLVSQIIDIIPAKGELKPHDTQQVTFVFNPQKLMKILGKALLIVSGGPEETVIFKGSCYHAVYELIPSQINFGFGPFCELWCSSLFIHNKGLKDIQVSVNIPEFDPSGELTEVIYLLTEKFGTSPKITFVRSCEVAAYKVALFPGRIGEIDKEFTIQIDDLPPLPVPMKGYALPHQVHIALPRTITPYLYENLYNVIACLTSQWFSLDEEPGTNLNSLDLSEDDAPLLEDIEEWEIVSKNAVSHVTTDDINMAYERFVCEVLSMPYNGTIPHTSSILGMNYLVGYDMPPYSLDFGSVIANTKAQCMVVYSNYCPIETIIKINFPENSEDLLDRYGVVLKPLCSHILQPSETKQFAILLRPPHNAIPPNDIEKKLTFSFNIKVSCGPSIPVNVYASITKPYLCIPDSFDFGYVKVGYKRYMKCVVSNINTVDCEWFAFIRPLRTYRSSDSEFNEKFCPFTVQPVYGYAEPKSKFIITIGFEPTDEALYEVVLEFIMNMNPQSVAIRLKGCGLKPNLIADDIFFGYCVPYSMPVRERLIIQNPCLFPVKAYVIGTPKDFPREQDLFKILLQYYKKDKICVPSTYYKNKPTNKIYMMFRRLVKKAVRKYLKDVLEFLDIILTESNKIWTQSEPKIRPLSTKTISAASQSKLKKAEKTQSRTPKIKKSKDKIKTEKSKEMLLFINTILEQNFVIKTLKQVINDYIKYMSLLNMSPSNLTLSGKVPIEESTHHHIETGDLIFVYGSPNSDAGKFSWRIRNFWKISTVSLDSEIINDLMENNFFENKFIMGAIMEYFLKTFEDEEKNKYDYNTIEGLKAVISLVSQEYFLQLKLMKEGGETKNRRLSKKKADSFKDPVTLLNIPWKYFQIIIVRRLYLKAENGLLFESIQSNFFLDPVSTLIVLLNVFQASRIYVICLCDDTDRDETGIDKYAPDADVIQAFSDLRYLEFFSLPKSVQEKMVEELKKSNKRIIIDDRDENISEVTETKKDVRRKGAARTTKAQKRTTNPQSVKDQDADKKNIKKRLPLSQQPELPPVKINEYVENLKKIQGFVEAYCSAEILIKNIIYRSSAILKTDDRYDEITKKKAKLRAIKEFPFALWIFCSHNPYRDYQFEDYIPLVQSWKPFSEKPKKDKATSQLQLENYNYFVIKKKVEKIYTKSEWENECKLFKIVNIDENLNPSEPVIAYTNVSRSKIQAQSKAELKMKENEIKKSSNIELIENLLKDMEVTYQKEMDHRLKIMNSKFKSGVKIKPGGYKQYDIVFQPTGCSNYKQDFHIRIGGCEEVKQISVFASCDIPDILFDPCSVFSEIIVTEYIDEISYSGYIVKNKAFHFGTALVGHENDGRLFEVKSILKLKNISAIDVQLSVSVIEEKIETGKIGEEEFNDKADLEIVKQFLKKNKITEGQHKLISALNMVKSESLSLTEINSQNELEPSPVFSFETPHIIIEPDEEKEFIISACPPLEGSYSCSYLFSIENNPKVYTLKAFCLGTAPKVVFNPVEFFFEDVIIYRHVSRSFSMENKCSLPLSWKIIDADSIHPKVSLSITHGKLDPECLEVVYVTYHPTEVQDIREQLIIQIFDENVKGKFLLEHKYSLHLRSYDVFTEVGFEKTNVNSLNLHDVIVFQRNCEEFFIKNRGRSDIIVKIVLNKDSIYLKNQVEVSLKDSFVLLTPQVYFQSEFSITCLEEVKLEEEPLVILEILDHNSMETVAEIPFYVSLISHFSRFTLSPTHNLDFGNLMVGELKYLEMILVNCGAIDFKFRLVPEKQCFSEEKIFLNSLNQNLLIATTRKSKKKQFKTVNQSKNLEIDPLFKKNLKNIIFMKKFLMMNNHEHLRNSDKHKFHFKSKILCMRQRKLKYYFTRPKIINSKNRLNYYDLVYIKTIRNLWNSLKFDDLKTFTTKTNKVDSKTNDEELEPASEKNKKLKCYIPPFRIVPAMGKLGAGKEVIIKVHCNPLCVNTFLETVNLFVTDALPEVRKGFPIHLSVESFLPKVDFEDYNSIFREIEVVEKCNEHFNNDCEGEPCGIFCIQEHSLYIFNTVVGTSHSVTAFLHSENQLDAAVLVTLSYPKEGGFPSFAINDEDSCVVYIKPYGYSSFTITFSPKHLEECKATITLSLEVPDSCKDKGWFSSITVVGKGNYPNLLMKLVNSIDEECELIDFGMVLINSSEKKIICLENIGNVTAQVILEVLNNKEVFLIGIPEQLEERLEICSADTFMNTKVSIPPKKKCKFELKFKPKESLTYSSRINVHILFNPFESLHINVYGTGYIGEIVIEGLKFTQGGPVTFSGFVPAEYFLDFGYCISGKKYSKEFSLINYCDNIIRFKFETYDRITFIPSCGHIYPSFKKTIISIIQISDCVELDETIECNYQEIIYKQIAQSEAWDNTHKSVKWTRVEGDSITKENFPKAQILKIERNNEEPEYNIMKEEVSFNIIVSAVFDIPKLTIVTELLEFPPIIVSQSTLGKVVIQNTKNCEISFTTEITDEIIETPESVPQVTDFSFGKFDYDLQDLPIEDERYSFELPSFSPPNLKTRKNQQLWNELRTKHTQLLYGKSVNIILPENGEKESRKESEVKVLKRTYRLKSSKSRSLLDIKKRGTYKKTISGTSMLASKRDLKVSDIKKGRVTLNVVKSFVKLGAKKSDLYEFNFSDLVKIGKTHIFLPTELPKTIVPPQKESTSQCFSINISSGTLKPKEIFTCHVKFTPKHIKHYKADLRFYNVETGEFSSIFLKGVGILPLCHIEIYEDDYLTVNNPIISHLPSNTRTVTVESVFKELNLKKSFNVYNIAEIPYHFKWIHLKNSNTSEKGIKCLTLEGEIPPRGSYEMVFTFFPMEYNVYESLWMLQIDEFFLEQFILLVFKIRKPLVSFERKFMVCEPTVKGFKRILSVKLINSEDIPFDYAVNEDSLYSGSRNDKCLCISPMLGTLGPKSEELLEIEFTPQCISDLTFHLRVNIYSHIHHLKYEISPLRILSKCYCVVPKIFCLKEDGSKFEIFHSDIKSDNIIPIGKLLLRIPYSLQFNISNAGDCPMYFETFLPAMDNQSGMSTKIIEKSGVVHPWDSNSFMIKLIANKKVDFEESLIIKICKGPDFFIKLTGTAAEPAYEFSHKSINFGICLIGEKNDDKHHKVLEFSNLDTESVLLEILKRVEGFIVDFSSLIIEPRAVHKIVIIFHPLVTKKYSGKLCFLVNGVYKHDIDVMGEGESLKLALHERESIIVDFGLLKAREISSEQIAIVNKSRVPINFFLKIPPQKNNDSFSLTIDVSDKKLHLLPDEVRVLKVCIYAEERIQNFTCNIMYEGCGIEEILFIVKGAIIDYKFELDQKSILFESAALGCVNTKQVALINSGDIGSRFRLQTQFVSDVFAVKPMEGYSPPSSRTIIEISFVANFITKYYNNIILFLIENYEPLTLNITGIGAKLPPPVDILKFQTNVRTTTSLFVDLINRTYEEMTVYPVITGEYFSTEDFVKVPANSHIDCKVFYHPQTMTTTQHHLGHFFCGFPNGELIFYQLVGEAKAPIRQVLFWEGVARKPFAGKIHIQNWSSSFESFKVEIRDVKLTLPAYYKMTSHDVISIPPKKKRNCIITLLCYKKNEMNFKVFVTNINSGEYLHYKVHVTFAAPEVQTFMLTTPVHEPVYHKICLTNPLDKITLFKFKSPHPNIEPLKKTIQVRPFRKKYLSLKYIPTHCGISEMFIKISNYLLGNTVYKLEVSAIKSGAQKLLEVEAPIGTTKSLSVPVKNPYKKVVAFIFKPDSKDLYMKNPSFMVGPGKKVMINVRYEPTSVGNNLMNFVLHTNGFGDFSYCIKGLCTPPQPSGPLIIPMRSQFELKFKNIFFFPQDFFLKLSNDQFKVRPEKLLLQAKETGSVFIALSDTPMNEEHPLIKGIPQAGKLTITCVIDINPTEWVYYLKSAE